MSLTAQYIKENGRLWPEISEHEEYLIRNYIDRYHRGEKGNSLESAIKLLIRDATKHHADRMKHMSFRELLGYDGNITEVGSDRP